MTISHLLEAYKSCSTWRGYQTSSKRFEKFLDKVHYLALTSVQKKALCNWNITEPPHLPPEELLTDNILALFALYCVQFLHLSRHLSNKIVNLQNEAIRDMGKSTRREFIAFIKILRSQP